MAATSVGAADVLAYQPLLPRAFPLPDLGSAGIASPPCGRVGEWASGSSGGRAVAVSGRAVRSACGGASRGRWGGGGWLYGRRVVGRSGDGIVACVARARCACARRVQAQTCRSMPPHARTHNQSYTSAHTHARTHTHMHTRTHARARARTPAAAARRSASRPRCGFRRCTPRCRRRQSWPGRAR